MTERTDFLFILSAERGKPGVKHVTLNCRPSRRNIDQFERAVHFPSLKAVGVKTWVRRDNGFTVGLKGLTRASAASGSLLFPAGTPLESSVGMAGVLEGSVADGGYILRFPGSPDPGYTVRLSAIGSAAFISSDGVLPVIRDAEYSLERKSGGSPPASFRAACGFEIPKGRKSAYVLAFRELPGKPGPEDVRRAVLETRGWMAAGDLPGEGQIQVGERWIVTGKFFERVGDYTRKLSDEDRSGEMVCRRFGIPRTLAAALSPPPKPGRSGKVRRGVEEMGLLERGVYRRLREAGVGGVTLERLSEPEREASKHLSQAGYAVFTGSQIYEAASFHTLVQKILSAGGGTLNKEKVKAVTGLSSRHTWNLFMLIKNREGSGNEC